MPFNVVDEAGLHLGYVAGNSPLSIQGSRGFLVLLTEERIGKLDVDMDGIRAKVAGAYDARTLFGGIKEEVLRGLTEKILVEMAEDPTRQSQETALKLLLMKRHFDLKEFLRVDTEGPGGYVLLQGDALHVNRAGALVLSEPMEYITEERAPKGQPIHFQVEEMPVVELEAMGMGEGLLLGSNWSDFGGRNHTHETHLVVRSGNVTTTMTFPVQLHLKKGMGIQVYLEEGSVVGLVADGIYYRWNRT